MNIGTIFKEAVAKMTPEEKAEIAHTSKVISCRARIYTACHIIRADHCIDRLSDERLREQLNNIERALDEMPH